MTQNVKIIDSARNVVATATVEDKVSHYAGTVELAEMPESLRKVFEKYETIINEQTFSLLDEIEERIQQTPLFAVFGDGRQVSAVDLQIFPSARSISFKTCRAPTSVAH